MDHDARVLSVTRFDPQRQPMSWIQDFEVAGRDGLTVLDALLGIRSSEDPSLAFRHACRGAVCGSCAMMIDGAPALACRVQVATLGKRVGLAPLANFAVLKDLVVDMDPFFAALEKTMPWLAPADPDPGRERRVAPEAMKEPDPFSACVMCGSCVAVCPASARDPGYLGPAALARAYRFFADPRDGAGDERLRLVDSKTGVLGCDMVRNCVKVCPKGVNPTRGIGRMRGQIKKAGRADAGHA